MTAILIRLLVFAALFGVIYMGVRAIKRQWMAHFRAIGDQRRQADKMASKSPEVIDLKRSGDGVFRPNAKSGDGAGKKDQAEKSDTAQGEDPGANRQQSEPGSGTAPRRERDDER
jgi:hypothetical protein